MRHSPRLLSLLCALMTAFAALPACGVEDPTGTDANAVAPALPLATAPQVDRARVSATIRNQLATLRSSGWDIPPLDAFRSQSLEAPEDSDSAASPEVIWTRLSAAASRTIENGKSAQMDVVVAWSPSREPYMALDPRDDASRAVLEADLDAAGSPDEALLHFDLEAPASGTSAASVWSAASVYAGCAKENHACGSTKCCAGYTCKYRGSTTTCGCARSVRRCSYVSKFGAGEVACMGKSLMAYYKKRTVVSCQNGDALRADACGRGIACPANPYADSDQLICGMKQGCGL